jgi:hypothetical protein
MWSSRHKPNYVESKRYSLDLSYIRCEKKLKKKLTILLKEKENAQRIQQLDLRHTLTAGMGLFDSSVDLTNLSKLW